MNALRLGVATQVESRSDGAVEKSVLIDTLRSRFILGGSEVNANVKETLRLGELNGTKHEEQQR